MAALISVIIPAWNREGYLGAALDSVFAQGRDDLEIVVVDDGSTDGTAALARARGIRVVQQQRQGPGAARNRGVAETTAPLIAFLDSDDWWEPHKLARQVEVLMERPAAGLTVGRLRNVLQPGYARPDWIYEAQLMVEPNLCFLQASLIRRHTFWAIGPLKTETMLGDDTDWFVRARAAGVEMVMLDDIVVNRLIHPTNLSDRERIKESTDLLVGTVKDILDRRRGRA